MRSAATRRALTSVTACDVEPNAVEGVRPLAGEALVQRAPGFAQAIDFERGQVDVAGAQVADGDPVMGLGRLDRGVEIGEIAGQSRAC